MSKAREFLKTVPGLRPAVLWARSGRDKSLRCLRSLRSNHNTKFLRSLRDIGKGKRAWILGNGPSLTQLDLSLLKDEITFTCNAIFLLFAELDWVPTYYMVEDCYVAEDYAREINNLHGPVKIFPQDLKRVLRPDDKTCYVDFIRGDYPCFPRFSGDCCRQVYWGGTVAYMMLQLADWMGYNPICMIGMDMSYEVPDYIEEDGVTIVSREADVNHFHPDYFGPGKRWHHPKVSRMKLSLQYAAQHLAAKGVRIINATAGGKLEAFQRIAYEDVLRHPPWRTDVRPRSDDSDASKKQVPSVTSTRETCGPKPDMSIIVCTHNRSSMLEVTVRSLLNNAGLPPDCFELLVIANNCVDDTEGRVAKLRSTYDNLRLVEEKSPGLANARNRGIIEARADILLFFDDDIVANPDYAQHMLAAFSCKSVLAVGARVLHDPDSPAPRWMKSRYPGYVATRLDLGLKATDLDEKPGPVGAAMAFRREVFDRFGLFCGELGRRGSNLLANEELDILRKVKTIPLACHYVPLATVTHFTHPQRMSRAYMLQRAFWKGISNSRSNLKDSRLRGVPSLPRAIVRWFRTLLSAIRRSAVELLEASFTILMATACHLGSVVEFARRVFSRDVLRRLKRSLPGRAVRAIGGKLVWAWHVLLLLLNRRPDKLSVQIQSTSVCNGRCVICPYLDSWHNHNPGRMSDELFDDILRQLKGMKIDKFCMYLANEPLCDGELIERLEKVIENLEFKVLEISTNASILTPEKAEALASLLGHVPHAIWISFHGCDKESYERIMGLDFERSLANVVNLLKLADKRKLNISLRGAGSALRKDNRSSPHHFTARQYHDFWETVFLKHQIVNRPKLTYLRYHDRAGSIRRNEYNFELERTLMETLSYAVMTTNAGR